MSEPSRQKEIIPNSKNIKVEENEDQLTLIYLSSNNAHIIYGFLLFIGAFLAILAAPPNFGYLPILLLPIALLIYYWIYKVMTSNTLILIDKKIGYLSKKMSYQARAKLDIPISQIKQFYIKKELVSGENGRTFETYRFMYIDQEDYAHVLLGIGDASDAIFLEHTLENFLGMDNISVRGEI